MTGQEGMTIMAANNLYPCPRCDAAGISHDGETWCAPCEAEYQRFQAEQQAAEAREQRARDARWAARALRAIAEGKDCDPC